ncbi:MAG TPA: SEC-C metal-binding domain-containing protein, partial [Steroidobacteraceae bacterium]|nr:SEC-C metal-binding domain-containing protein [Steroidobacteraceae bacterium]
HPNDDGSVSEDREAQAAQQAAQAAMGAVAAAMASSKAATAMPGGVPKVGRNEPCPCGSGKKYKQCHGKLA